LLGPDTNFLRNLRDDFLHYKISEKTERVNRSRARVCHSQPLTLGL